jgi:hypothetical protein
MAVLTSLGRAQDFEAMFAFQPVTTWIEKTLANEGTVIFEILDTRPRDWEVLVEYIIKQRDQHLGDVQGICADQGARFYDMNTDARFASDEWLFVDRVHLTDRRYELSAQTIREAFHL